MTQSKQFGRAVVLAVLLAVSVVLCVLTGCTSTNITSLTQALAKDPAAVHAKVMTPYGSMEFWRAGCLPNQTTSINSDGTMTVSMENTNVPSLPVSGQLRLVK